MMINEYPILNSSGSESLLQDYGKPSCFTESFMQDYGMPPCFPESFMQDYGKLSCFPESLMQDYGKLSGPKLPVKLIQSFIGCEFKNFNKSECFIFLHADSADKVDFIICEICVKQ